MYIFWLMMHIISRYQDNWEPDFSCLHERRIGGMGDGPKWVCDPHLIAKKRSKCLVYSVGSEGNFEFEESVLSEIHSDCEIHTFDPEIQGESFAHKAPPNVHYHAWGLDNSNGLQKQAGLENYMTLNETIQKLGHVGRTIDIFKIDCEGCELATFEGWFEADVTLKQILVEVHNSPTNVNDFFNRIQEEGYVTFHKEPNIKYAPGSTLCVEYAFLKLTKDFFKGMNFSVQEFPPVPAPVAYAMWENFRVWDDDESPSKNLLERVDQLSNDVVDLKEQLNKVSTNLHNLLHPSKDANNEQKRLNVTMLGNETGFDNSSNNFY